MSEEIICYMYLKAHFAWVGSVSWHDKWHKHKMKAAQSEEAQAQNWVNFSLLNTSAIHWTTEEKVINRPIYIGKIQNPKNLGFLLYRLHCQKNP